MATFSLPYGQATALIALTITLYLFVRKRAKHGLPYPPGPKPLPLIGNVLDIARENEAEAYQQLAKEHGDLVFLSVLGTHILFVNSFQHAHELFEKRSGNYADRPTSVMSMELMGWDFSFVHMRYGDRWRKHRRMFHRQFQPSVAPIYWPKQRKEAHALLRRLLRSPDKLDANLRLNAAAVVMSIAYGIPVTSTEDRYIAIAEKALAGMAKAANPGAFLVDFFPFLKHIPSWVPGASFQLKAQEWRRYVTEMTDAPFATVVKAVKTGQAPECFTSNLLSELDGKEDAADDSEIIKNCAGIIYATGAESTVSTLSTFILGVLTHPDVQVRAQKELDSVIGHDRLPEFSDRPSLPYIDAILKEVLRWNPVAPLSMPHLASNDDEYNGYFIPAGTIVIGNTRAILHDPNVYSEPHIFNPDRFMGLGSTEKQHFSASDPLSVSFGYGRRSCPGRYMAEAQVWISIACILSVFDISPALDADGRQIKVAPEFTSGMISHPVPFKFSMKPRSDAARILIEKTELEA